MTPTGRYVWRDFVSDGIPSSGKNKTSKREIRDWTDSLENNVATKAPQEDLAALEKTVADNFLALSALQSGGRVGFDTKVNLDLNASSYPVQQIAEVISDPAPANNGTYLRYGSGWVKLSNYTLTTVALEVLAARSGSATVGDRLASIVDSVLAVQKATAPVSAYRPTETQFRPQSALVPKQASFSVVFPKVTAASYGGDILIDTQTITFDAPTSAAMSEAKTLKYAGLYNGAINNSNFATAERLQYQYVTAVTVTRNSDSVVLVKGVDWDIKPNTGLIYGLKNIADVAVTVAYTGWKHRYDILYGPTPLPSSGYGMVKGTDRIADPEEYLPVTPAGFSEIWRVYIYVNPDGSPRADIIPRYRYRKRAMISRPGEYADLTQYNRASIAKYLGLVRKGTAGPIIGYGTSITAQGGGMGSNQVLPNVDRDVVKSAAGYFQTTTKPELTGRMPNDTAATIPLFDGPLGTAKHQHLGWNWYLKKALDDAYGVNLTYLNMGVPGSRSDNLQTSGIMGGLYPDRLNAMLALASNALLVIEFGTNEIGQPYTFSNLSGIIGYFYANGGAAVIVVPPPQVGYPGGADAFSQSSIGGEGWLGTHKQCVNAALYTGAAYVDMIRLDGQYPVVIGLGSPPLLTNYPTDPAIVSGANLDLWHHGCSGLSWMNLGSINLLNHPGREQLRQIGLMMGDIIGADERQFKSLNRV